MDWVAAAKTTLDCYGEAEIATLLGVSRSAVAQMRRRGNCGIPDEDTRLAMGPVWFPDTLDRWVPLEIERRYLSPALGGFAAEAGDAVDELRRDLLATPVLDGRPGPVTMAFSFNATRAFAGGMRASEWTRSLGAYHRDDPSFADILDDQKDSMLFYDTWPWRRSFQTLGYTRRRKRS